MDSYLADTAAAHNDAVWDDGDATIDPAWDEADLSGLDLAL